MTCLGYQDKIQGLVYNNDTTHSYWRPHFGLKMISSYSIFLSAFNYSFSEFPLYRAFAMSNAYDPTTQMLKACGICMGQTTIIYIISGILAVYAFGSHLQTSVLDNIGAEESFLGTTVQLLFLLLLICHIPYIFRLVKEGGITCVDEIRHGYLSDSIAKKLQGLPVPSHESRHADDHTFIVLLLYSIVLLVACLTQNLAAIFDYIGAFAISGNQFMIPGLCTIVLSRTQAVPSNLLCLGYTYFIWSFIATISILSASWSE